MQEGDVPSPALRATLSPETSRSSVPPTSGTKTAASTHWHKQERSPNPRYFCTASASSSASILNNLFSFMQS